MQSLNNISTSIAKDSATGGSSKASAQALGADFAAMLFDLSANEQQGLNGIFSAIAKIHSTNQGIGAKLPLSSSKNSNSVSPLSDRNSTVKKSSSMRSKESDDECQDKDDEKDQGHASSAIDDTCQWMSALLNPATDTTDSSQDRSDLLVSPADENVSDDILLGAKLSDKSKGTNVQASIKQQNLADNATVLQDYAKSLLGRDGLHDGEGIHNEDSSLAYMMTQSGVQDLKISNGTQLSLLEKNADELGFIDDSLHALQNFDDNNSSENFADNNSQAQSLNYALQQLRESLSTSVENGANAVASNASFSDEQSDPYAVGSIDIQNISAESDDPSGAAQGLSDARAIAKENRSSQLRKDMLTLSSDVRKNAEEISKAVMTMAARNMKKFTFDLNPNGLGRMEISIDADENDKAVNVTIAAQEMATRRLVAQSIDALKLALFDNGIDAKTSMTDFSGEGSFGDGQQEKHHQEESGILFAKNSIDDEDVEQSSVDEMLTDDGALNLFA